MMAWWSLADDMLVHCRGDRKSAAGLNQALHKLHLFSGLTVNIQKGKAFFSRGCKEKDDIAANLGVQADCLPTTNLGLPLTRVYPKAKHYSPLIDKSKKQD